jgi:putative ABC transport system permease protein
MHPLAMSQFRYNRLQSALNAEGIGFEVMALLMLAEISRNLSAPPYAALMIGWVTVLAMLWFVLIVSALFVVLSRYAQTRERTQEFAILKMLGASTGYICDLLCQETVLVVAPGTVLGILLSYGGRYIIETSFPDLFFLRAAYEWWPLACLISALGFLFAGLLAVRAALGNDLVKALGYEE